VVFSTTHYTSTTAVNFWVRDWREVHEVLAPYGNVTNIPHTHQVLYNESAGCAPWHGGLMSRGRTRPRVSG